MCEIGSPCWRADHAGGSADEHIGAVEGAEHYPLELAARPEPCVEVDRHVIAIRPDPQLGIIGKIGRRGESITVISACSIGSCRDREAYCKGFGEDGLHQDPPASEFVILGNWVTAIAGFAWAAKPVP